MRKILSIVLAMIIALSCASFTALAESDIRIVIDGEYKTFDVMPVIENSRTLVPMRGIFETLGAVVNWDEDTRTVMTAKGDTVVMLQIDNKTAWVNGEAKELDTPAKIMDSRTMVPVRFIAETFGCRVEWDEAQRRVFVYSKNDHQKGFEALDGKRILFVGNSFIYYGRTVAAVGKSKLAPEDRIDTQGAFYQLCKANGIDVNVVNLTFGAHTIGDILSDACPRSSDACAGKKHLDSLTDKNFDYVVFSPASGTKQEAAFADDCDKLMGIFREANPDVKFVCLGNIGAYGFNSYKSDFPGISTYYKTLEKKGVTIADWGGLVKGIIDGTYKVPETAFEYNALTFVNSKDNYHPNLLAGYLTTLFTYCAITGESAIGQPYGFYKDASLAPVIDIPGYTDYYYKEGDAETNYPEILASETEMRGIQQLIDKYIAEKPYLK